MALIADHFTFECLSAECMIKDVLPWNYKSLLKSWKPDILLVESAFHAGHDAWQHRIADHPKKGINNTILKNVVNTAKSLSIPTVFWNKDDGAHFERFINSASLFDHIFTSDINTLPRYRAIVNSDITVKPLMIPFQPAFHNFTGFNFKFLKASFAGTYYIHKYERRKMWQHMIFEACKKSELPIVVYDRNAYKNIKNFKFPREFDLDIKSSISHHQTANLYKDYAVSINVNTIEDSETMYSRRLVEILACGGILVTTPSKAVDKNFKDFCHIVNTLEGAVELFSRLKHGPDKTDLERAAAGAEYVAKHHTWTNAIDTILKFIH
ncbi:MAG: hypothetical protein A2X47_11965 [Lentisphaerae bacterium GWF2_38_69]|nr:MAG: hypothetical protein A2X47_11965 [Lentisphaerae bacterium GWF2_38_69]